MEENESCFVLTEKQNFFCDKLLLLVVGCTLCSCYYWISPSC